MMISDKQELRRCVKQLVRRADVCEAGLSFDVAGGEVGVAALTDLWARQAATPGEAFDRSTAEQTPFSEDAAAAFAALDAMDLPVRDLNRAQSLQREYERSAYIGEVLDTMRAKCVLVRVRLEGASQVQFDDNRFEPLLDIGRELFVPGRYGVDYAAAAARIAEAAALCGARNIAFAGYDYQALTYCILPACQDAGLVLHMHLENKAEVAAFSALLDQFDGVRALVSADDEALPCLIDAAAKRVRLLVLLRDPAHIRKALSKLGTRFVPYSAQAVLPEQMLGRWILAKEAIWQALCDAYLPLARAGYELSSSAIERDVRKLLSGNLLALCRQESDY